MAEIILKKKEAKTITFTVKDSVGVVVDLTGCTFYFGLKELLSDSTFLVEKQDSDFGKSLIASGIITMLLSSSNTNMVGKFKGELKITFDSTNIDKSEIIDIIIKDAVTS